MGLSTMLLRDPSIGCVMENLINCEEFSDETGATKQLQGEEQEVRL